MLRRGKECFKAHHGQERFGVHAPMPVLKRDLAVHDNADTSLDEVINSIRMKCGDQWQ